MKNISTYLEKALNIAIAMFRKLLPNTPHQDKWMHAISGAIIFIIAYTLAGLVFAYLITLTACILKELWDYSRHGKFCWWDLVAGMTFPVIALNFYGLYLLIF